MQYRKNSKNGDELSAIGFGCMRFPKAMSGIDMAETEREILHAVENGVNYFDTAYIYPGSEAALGEILYKNNLRDKVKIATKLPHYLIKNTKSIEDYFNQELERLKTDHVDYYLMHMLSDKGVWERLCDLGIKEWIEEKKAQGKIHNIGFSYHGNTETFIELLDAYDWEFCQIQYNYMDEHSQAGRKGLMHAAEKGIPVIIMEPLRGGRLVNNLPKEALEAFDNAKVKRSPAEWGLKWLFDQPQVTVVLSGMNSMEMLDENIRIASETLPNTLKEEDFAMYEKVKEALNLKIKVGCTGCRYCMPCPQGVDIPGAFRAYNVKYTDGYFTGMREYIMCTAMRAKPSNASLCIGCGKCEKHCPQGIEIRKELKNVVKNMETPVFKAVRFAVTKIGMFRGKEAKEKAKEKK